MLIAALIVESWYLVGIPVTLEPLCLIPYCTTTPTYNNKKVYWGFKVQRSHSK